MISQIGLDFYELNRYIADSKITKIFFLVDKNTHDCCLPLLLDKLQTNIPYEIIELEPGEKSKNIDISIQLWETLSNFEADRNSLMINLGGGVITDIGGFVASTYKRGIDFINIPTSLLAMTDASIGGKTGVDHIFLKNIIGTFTFPRKIFIHTDFLFTLDVKELKSGFAEMLKHGLIADEKYWKDLISIKTLSHQDIIPYIEKSMMIKQKITEEDFKEKNIRKTLNFGHTIGHAIESLFLKANHSISHGEAVVLGMIMESHLSFLENFLSFEKKENIIENLQKFYPYINIEMFTDEEIISLMKNDKKNVDGKIYFSLLEDVGKANYDCKVSEENILKSIHFYHDLANKLNH